MSQLSGLSDSRPSSWRFPRPSPPGSHRDWGRSAYTETHRSAQREQNHVLNNCWREPLFADLTAAGDEDRHWHSDVSVWEDGQRHQGVHQHTAGGWESISFSRDILSYMLHLHHTVCSCVYSFFMVEASSRWTSRPSSVSLWDRRTRTKACSICGRRSSSYRVPNGTEHRGTEFIILRPKIEF